MPVLLLTSLRSASCSKCTPHVFLVRASLARLTAKWSLIHIYRPVKSCVVLGHFTLALFARPAAPVGLAIKRGSPWSLCRPVMPQHLSGRQSGPFTAATTTSLQQNCFSYSFSKSNTSIIFQPQWLTWSFFWKVVQYNVDVMERKDVYLLIKLWK